MQSRFSIVRQDQFIKATRDSGYKGTASALSELIDNSIQAGATEVNIRLIAVENEATGPGKPKMPRVVEIAIADNGRGMPGELLRRAIRFGDSDRFNDRSGLGRFGMGLPNASVSQCTHFEVFSWQKGQQPVWTYVDVDEVAAEKMVEIPEPVEHPIPAPYEHLIDLNKGTLVVWRDCDRLDHDGKLDTLIRTLRPALGRIFRHFLVADFKITINGTPIEPFDPLYLMPEARLPQDLLATQHGDTLKFEVPIPSLPGQTSTVEVVFSLLPDQWQVAFKKDKKELQRRHIDDSRGFSIVRGRREIDVIKSPYHAKHWTDTWYRVEMRFDPELDEVFGVTHTKQHAAMRPGTMIYEKLREAITANVNTMKDMIVARGKKAHEVRTKQAEDAVQKVEPRLKPIEGLAEKPQDLVWREVQKFVEHHAAEAPPQAKQDLEDRLSKYTVLIEYENLPGAPFYRIKVVGRSIVVLLNTHHRFYERCYQRIEAESPLGKTGIDLLLMALGRSEALASEEAVTWYDDQRHEWSQHIKAFLEPVDEPEPEDVQLTEVAK
jgi:anti-sigma regulatory factor (Ser/Thr protein kinase)